MEMLIASTCNSVWKRTKSYTQERSIKSLAPSHRVYRCNIRNTLLVNFTVQVDFVLLCIFLNIR